MKHQQATQAICIKQMINLLTMRFQRGAQAININKKTNLLTSRLQQQEAHAVCIN